MYMTASHTNHDQLRASADALGQRLSGDPTAVGESTADLVRTLQALGVPGGTIADLLRAEGMEEEDVAGYNLAPTPPNTTEPVPIIVQTVCIGTCPIWTIVITWGPRRQS
jgi:hypothetical protein